MRVMTADVLDDLADICRHQIGYRACIFCENDERARVIQTALLQEWHGTIEDSYYNGGRAVFFTSTRSVVRIMTRSETFGLSRYRCEAVVIDNCYTPSVDELRFLESIIIPAFRRLDTGELVAYRQHIQEMQIDEFVGVPGNNDRIWRIGDHHDTIIEFINNSAITVSMDLGEISPSQELHTFINTLQTR